MRRKTKAKGWSNLRSAPQSIKEAFHLRPKGDLHFPETVERGRSGCRFIYPGLRGPR